MDFLIKCNLDNFPLLSSPVIRGFVVGRLTRIMCRLWLRCCIPVTTKRPPLMRLPCCHGSCLVPICCWPLQKGSLIQRLHFQPPKTSLGNVQVENYSKVSSKEMLGGRSILVHLIFGYLSTTIVFIRSRRHDAEGSWQFLDGTFLYLTPFTAIWSHVTLDLSFLVYKRGE